jgi:hypothetical protein
MTTARQRSNLKRGGVSATAASAARARAAKDQHAAEADALADLAVEDEFGYLKELHRIMARHLAGLLAREERQRAQPSRATTDRLRELRVATSELRELQAEHGKDLETAAFLRTLDARVAEASARLGAPQPVITPPPATP